jgi:hypothetical protein
MLEMIANLNPEMMGDLHTKGARIYHCVLEKDSDCINMEVWNV